MPVSSSQLHALLREQFGHEGFRPSQERIIWDLLDGRDVLAVLPTGAGKSLVFQLTAQLLPGATVVVSPLIALMKDQAESLESHGVEVGVINSARTATQSAEELHRVERSEAKLLYVTPERLEDAGFMGEMEQVEVSLLVVDEAHCLSEWGYDFRPAYLGLRGAAERLGRPMILALTATATPWVRRDIIDRLGMREPDVVVRSADRPNLFFEVRPVQTEEEEYRVLRALFEGSSDSQAPAHTIQPSGMRSLLAEPGEEYPPELTQQLAEAMQGSGIIYTATTRAAQKTVDWLRDWGIAADYYHGQRKKSDRNRIQEAFMAGELRVIAATNAFGLGVDKPDVRFVLHRQIPASVEEYYQEAGRAGRDGQFARCTLFYRQADLGRTAFLSSSGRVSRTAVEKLHRALQDRPEAPASELIEAAGLTRSRGARTIALLGQEGVLEEQAGQVRLLADGFDPGRISLEGEERHREYERSRLQMMRTYAELRDCRRAYLLNYFGQEAESLRCGLCDNDCAMEAQSGSVAENETKEMPFVPGDRVKHVRWGEGEVTGVAGETLTVRFEHGDEKLAVDLVLEERLLTHARSHRGQRGSHPMRDGAAVEQEKAGRVAVGERVVHDLFGEGEVQPAADGGITVLFDDAGYKTIEPAALDEGELVPAQSLDE